MSKPEPPPDIDIAALLQSVHGRSEEARRQDQVDQALKAIESTHRKASLAVRNFEHHGRLEAEANVLAALGALADDSQAPPQASVAPQASAPPQASVPPQASTPLRAPSSPLVEAEGAAGHERTQAAEAPQAAARAPVPGGMGASGQPSQTAAQVPQGPALLSDEPTLPGNARTPQKTADPTAAALPAVSSTEVTHTYVVGPASDEAGSPASTGRDGPGRQAPSPVPTAKLKPASVYSGRGAPLPKQEPTQTKLVRRPKP